MRTTAWLTIKEAAAYLQVAERTLQDWRTKKIGPPYAKQHQVVRYHRHDLDKWMKSRK